MAASTYWIAAARATRISRRILRILTAVLEAIVGFLGTRPASATAPGGPAASVPHPPAPPVVEPSHIVEWFIFGVLILVIFGYLQHRSLKRRRKGVD